MYVESGRIFVWHWFKDRLEFLMSLTRFFCFRHKHHPIYELKSPSPSHESNNLASFIQLYWVEEFHRVHMTYMNNHLDVVFFQFCMFPTKSIVDLNVYRLTQQERIQNSTLFLSLAKRKYLWHEILIKVLSCISHFSHHQ